MSWIVANVKWVLLVSGALTCTMIYAAFAPAAAAQSTFGESLDGPVADVVVRNWGALVALVGAMMLYAAFNPPVRPMVVAVAGISKLVFIGLVLMQGTRFLGYQAGVAVVVDLVMVSLFVAYLIGSRRSHAS